jgi:hypothetical protein
VLLEDPGKTAGRRATVIGKRRDGDEHDGTEHQELRQTTIHVSSSRKAGLDWNGSKHETSAARGPDDPP